MAATLRKGEAQIKAEIAADRLCGREGPAPARPLMGDAETTRVQRLREFNGGAVHVEFI